MKKNADPKKGKKQEGSQDNDKSRIVNEQEQQVVSNQEEAEEKDAGEAEKKESKEDAGLNA